MNQNEKRDLSSRIKSRMLPGQVIEVDNLDNLNNPDVLDLINFPPHYKRGGIEAIEVIEAWNLNFNIGNVIKYSCRAGSKNPQAIIQDLKKAQYYINREIHRLEQTSDKTPRD